MLLHFFSQVAGLFYSIGFNQSVAAFALKDEEEADGSGTVLRHPLNLRPLGLKSSSNKIIAKTTDRLIFPVVSSSVHSDQQGFVKGRNF